MKIYSVLLIIVLVYSFQKLDVLGNEVATLVNEEKPPSTYEVKFSAENVL